MLSKKQEFLLQKVQKPARYIGGEVNSVVKDKSKIKFRYAFCFPDNYEIGMSHLGMKILYSLVNEREDAWCERGLCSLGGYGRGDREETMFLCSLLKAATACPNLI